jgi:hypothetical protein
VQSDGANILHVFDRVCSVCKVTHFKQIIGPLNDGRLEKMFGAGNYEKKKFL